METQELLECPYDRSHRILKHRMQIHLGKCRRNHKNEPQVTCPFNIIHVMKKPELEYHISVCSERKTLEYFRSTEDPSSSSKPNEPPPMPFCEIEENWDNENAPAYNPTNYLSKAQVLRNIAGVTPSERKQFRQQERLRLLGKE